MADWIVARQCRIRTWRRGTLGYFLAAVAARNGHPAYDADALANNPTDDNFYSRIATRVAHMNENSLESSRFTE